MAKFADSGTVPVDADRAPALASAPAAALVLVSPTLPAGELLLQANLYAVCELIAARAARASSGRQYRARGCPDRRGTSAAILTG